MTRTAKASFLAIAKIEDFNFKNKMLKVLKNSSFQLFVHFSTDSDRPAIKFFRTEFRYAYILI